MFLETIAFIRSIPCLAEPGKIIVVGKPTTDLTPVLPYLANLPNAIVYRPDGASLTLRRQPGLITLSKDRIYLTQVEHVHQGIELLEILKEAINTTWEKRHALKKVETAMRRPTHLEIWKLLPQTNCGLCEEATCLAFAVALVTHKKHLGLCTPIYTHRELAEKRALLENLV